MKPSVGIETTKTSGLTWVMSCMGGAVFAFLQDGLEVCGDVGVIGGEAGLLCRVLSRGGGLQICFICARGAASAEKQGGNGEPEKS